MLGFPPLCNISDEGVVKLYVCLLDFTNHIQLFPFYWLHWPLLLITKCSLATFSSTKYNKLNIHPKTTF